MRNRQSRLQYALQSQSGFYFHTLNRNTRYNALALQLTQRLPLRPAHVNAWHFPARTFSTLDNAMSIEQAELLYEYQERFEKEPTSIEKAYKLFRELNKHGMYLTVIRLYYRHELEKASTTD